MGLDPPQHLAATGLGKQVEDVFTVLKFLLAQKFLA